MNNPELSLVIPTYNERAGVRPLVDAIAQALGGLSWEAVFVDDSTDGTDSVIASLGQEDERIRLVHRPTNVGGLAGAVVEGFAHARGTYVCVMDADLQHPPARIPDLLNQARATRSDVVVASRYTSGGSAGGLDGGIRVLASRGLTALARLAFPARLASISDPLGGFFIIKSELVQGAELKPIGYKILLEILVRTRWMSASEVAYTFAPRQYEASKADFRQGMRFLRHLMGLVWDCSPLFTLPRFAASVNLVPQR